MTSVFCLFNCEGFSFSFAIDYLNLLLICELEINVKKFNSYLTDFWLRWQSLRLTLFCNNKLYTTLPTFDSGKILPFYQTQTTYKSKKMPLWLCIQICIQIACKIHLWIYEKLDKNNLCTKIHTNISSQIINLTLHFKHSWTMILSTY